MILLEPEDFILSNPPDSGDPNQYLKVFNYCVFLQKKVTIDMVYPVSTALIRNVQVHCDSDETGNYGYLNAKDGAGFFHRKLPKGKWIPSEEGFDILQHIIEGGKLEIDDEVFNKILNGNIT